MWIAVVVVAVLLGGLGLLLWQGARDRQGTKRELDRIKALSSPEARTMALQLLGDPELFQCKAASATDPLPILPQSVTDLLTRFDLIVRGEFWIGRSALVQTARKPGYRKIGEDFEFTELLVRPDSEAVYVSYGEEPPNAAPEAVATAWHLIIQVSGVRV
jgi:hypothetical protein